MPGSYISEQITMDFDNRQELISTLYQRMTLSGVPQEMSMEVAEQLPSFFEQPAGPRRGFELVFKRWAIRDDDLKVIDFVCSSLTVGAAAATGGPLLAVGAAAVTALIKLTHSCLKKGAKITTMQQRLLLGLKADSRGKTIENLAEWMHEAYPGDQCSTAVVERELASLQSIALADGTMVALVSKTGGGLWHAAGV
jgi:hypothetical protein